MKQNCILLLEDGSYFTGISFGANPDENSSGEVVFNTGMSGYHEILTDPSYTGQIVTMTYPHIGNYGDMSDWTEVGPEDEVRTTIKARALVIRSLYRGMVPKGRKNLEQFLKENNITGITNVDTRALTIKLRKNGAQKGIIVNCEINNGVPDKDSLEKAKKIILDMPEMEGQNLIKDVGTSQNEIIGEDGKMTFAVVDCGIKANIIRELKARNVKVKLFPSTVKAEELLDSGVSAVLVANGPGDPSVLTEQIDMLKKIIGKIPVFGICLGHQMISLALGAKTYKMKFGHHGINNPVRDELSKRVFVTSQNHGFAVKEESLPDGVDLWFKNANDGSVEGIISKERNIASVQFHPEASPGPVDTSWIFDEYIKIAGGE
ncbi:MAG: glutamine-hydrolyzing carbamoyl-phosphate synthase small subunit [Spirochaetales bacterium]|nr:glutamine-hydrolyzing carbamoyl-phosphate synthase small subunit [Spirochaetales bacterium]